MTDEVLPNRLISHLGEQIGALALRCSETAGFVAQVGSRIAADHGRLEMLNQSVDHLAFQQGRANSAAEQIRQVSRQATAIVGESQRGVHSALGEIGGLIDEVVRMGDEVAGFAEAIEQVATISGKLGAISRQTSILAINASIEAARAGDGASGFAAVAAEVKRLARDASDATALVSGNIAALETRARRVLADLHTGAERGRVVREHASAIQNALDAISGMIARFDASSAAIESVGDQVTRNVDMLAEGLESFARTTAENLAQLGEARARLDELESASNRMFNQIGHSGIETEDSPFIRMAVSGADSVRRRIVEATERGELSVEQLFDTGYVAVEGSDPVQFLTRFVPFADRHLQPLLDSETGRDARIVGCCLVDRNGWLPTHISARSLPQRAGDRIWNLEHARNRQIFMDRQTRHALDHDGDWFLYTYRQDFGDGRYRALRSVFVPMIFAGRCWGLYELGYLI